MTKFVLGALALAASSTPCLAGSDSAWLAVDRDIESLATTLAPAASGATVNGFLRASYASSSDIPVGANDLGGFSIDDARLNFAGNVGNYSVFVSVEGSNDADQPGAVGTAGALNVLDAFATFPVTGEIRGQIGQFRSPLLASSNRSEDSMLFIDRSAIGHNYSGRDQGVMLTGNFDQLGWMLAVMNGVDSAGDEWAYAARVQFTAMGHANNQEGAYGATEETCLTIGVGLQDDQDDLIVGDDQVTAVDANFTMGALSAMLQMVDQDTNIGDNTPWDFAFGYMISPDQWEAAFRYEDADDANDTTAMTVGLNLYQNGHAAKWQFNYTTVDSDNAALEVDVIQAGLCASI